MVTFSRLALLAAFFVLLKEGMRLAFASLFLLEPESPFPIIYGVVLGVTAILYSFVCVALVFQHALAKFKIIRILIIFALGLIWIAWSTPTACNTLLMQTHPIELLTCQRLPRLSLGFGLFSIFAAVLWSLNRK